MSHRQNPAWYQQNTNQNASVSTTDQQYAYQIPAQAVAFGRPYVPSDYDQTTMGRSRASPLANVSVGIHGVQGQLGGASQGSANTHSASQGATPVPGNAIAGGLGGASVISAVGSGPAAVPLALLQHPPPPGLSSLGPTGQQVPMLGQTHYVQMPVQTSHYTSQAEYGNYQGSNFQLHPDQWDQLAIGLRKPGESMSSAGLETKRKSSSGEAAPLPKDANSVGPNPASKVTKRSRMGCLTCRQRKKRCCESKPKCTECLRLGLNCVWPKPGTEHKNKPKEVKREENMIDHDVYGKIRVLRGIVEYRSN